MTFVYKLVGLDRDTERLADAYEIPADQVERAKPLDHMSA
jgi:hypothetical protein